MQIDEHRAHCLFDNEAVTWGSAGGSQCNRLARQRLLRQHIEERDEEPGGHGVVNRGNGDDGVRARHLLKEGFELLTWEAKCHGIGDVARVGAQ